MTYLEEALLHHLKMENMHMASWNDEINTHVTDFYGDLGFGRLYVYVLVRSLLMRMTALLSRRSAVAILVSFFLLTLIFYFVYPFFVTLTHTVRIVTDNIS